MESVLIDQIFYDDFQEFGFVYDSSITAPVTEMPYWPYTLDYRIPHKCIGTQIKKY